MLLTANPFLFSMLLPPILLTLAYILSTRSFKDREKSSAFECGFDPKSNARIPFSTRFFLLAVIFLVFDIEIVLLMPSPLLIQLNMLPSFLMAMVLFLIILMVGLLHEWREGSLAWGS